MKFPLTVRLDFLPGSGPGANKARLTYVLPDGSEMAGSDIYDVLPGHSLTLAPVDVEVTLSTAASWGATPTSSATAPATTAAAPGAGAPAKPAIPGRR